MSEALQIHRRPAPRSASTSREGARIALIVLHGDARPAQQALEAYAASGSRSAPHYYVAADGATWQLVDEARAARHSGTARLGRRRNVDRIAVGVTIEGALDAPLPQAQASALRRLIGELRERHDLLADAALTRWTPPAGAEIDGRLDPYAPPPAPPRPRPIVLGADEPAVLGVEDDPAAAQRLWSFLQNEAARQFGGGFNVGSAFHLHAAKNGMGAPLGPSSPRAAWINVGGRQFNYQHFARDSAFNEGESWTAVQNLSALLDGSFPAPGGVEFELLKSSYAAGIAASRTPATGNRDFNPTWAFPKFAVQNRLGPPLSGNYRITVAGNTYAVQVYAGDTLYTPVANPDTNTDWSDVRLLSAEPAGALREALWAETYKPSAAAYQASSPFQQAAAAAKVGAPLSGVYQASFEGSQLSVQVFALDTLYQAAGAPVKRQSALAQPPQVSGWAPKPAQPTPTPRPPVTITPGSVNVSQPGGDHGSPSWPPPPANLQPLYDLAARQRLFGKYEYDPAPLPNNQEHIRIRGTWQQDNIVPVQIPQLVGRNIRNAPRSGTVFWHKLAVKQLLQLWAAWEQAGLMDRIVIYAGDFNARFSRGTTTLSNHAFGTAFDINCDFGTKLNWLGVQPALVGQYGCVRELVAIANACGFYWGGHFGGGRQDGMHFEIAELRS